LPAIYNAIVWIFKDAKHQYYLMIKINFSNGT